MIAKSCLMGESLAHSKSNHNRRASKLERCQQCRPRYSSRWRPPYGRRQRRERGSDHTASSKAVEQTPFDHNLVRRGPWPKRGAPGLLSKSCCPVKPPLSSSHPDRSQLLNPVGVQAGSRTVSQLTGAAGKVIEVDGVGGHGRVCRQSEMRVLRAIE